jgi:predicted dithiol-disulfide oxidoreductase (DUF899 family)
MSYPGESEEYRRARDLLRAEEVELRNHIERVAGLRRALPMGGLAEDYQFTGHDGVVTLAELFAPGKDSLLLYSYMYAPDDDAPCPMCTSFLDTLNASARHVTQRAGVAVVAQAPYETLAAVAKDRGWQRLRLASAGGSNYQRDYLAEDESGNQRPMMNVFVKADDGVRHFWGSEAFFADVDGHPRHIDLVWPVWHLLDMVPDGRGDWMPGLDY